MHEPVGILAEFFACFRMLLQILLQVAVFFDKLLVIYERRILAQLFGNARVRVQEIIEAGELSPSHVVAVLCLPRHRLRMGARWRISSDKSAAPEHDEVTLHNATS